MHTVSMDNNLPAALPQEIPLKPQLPEEQPVKIPPQIPMKDDSIGSSEFLQLFPPATPLRHSSPLKVRYTCQVDLIYHIALLTICPLDLDFFEPSVRFLP